MATTDLPTQQASPVRKRIMATAFDLFYRQGYRATGINQVIAESGVAKASFYDHFPSKRDLLHAYVLETARRELADLRGYAQRLPSARERFFGPLRMLEPWFTSTNYRGCPFQNVIADAGPEDDQVRQVAREYADDLRTFFAELTQAVVDEEKLTGVNVASVADTYVLLLNGVIALAVLYRDPWPVHQAERALANSLGLTGR